MRSPLPTSGTGFPSAGDQIVRLYRDRNAIIRIEASPHELGGNFTHSGFDHLALGRLGLSSRREM
jgi:hypothetical protein